MLEYLQESSNENIISSTYKKVLNELIRKWNGHGQCSSKHIHRKAIVFPKKMFFPWLVHEGILGNWAK